MFNFYKDWKKDETKMFILQVAGIFIGTFAIIVIIASIFGLIPETLIPVSNTKSGIVSKPTSITNKENTEKEKEEVTYTRDRNTNNKEEQKVITLTKPTGIFIPSIGVDAQILHPSSILVDVLDEALKKGAVYYPGSGTLEDGNIFLFGHSTNWLVVQNQAYKTFNDLDKLNKGEEISLKGEDGKTYVYEVETVTLVNSDTAFVDLSRTGRRLTISTCDTFGKKADRWVVDAVFKEVRG